MGPCFADIEAFCFQGLHAVWIRVFGIGNAK